MFRPLLMPAACVAAALLLTPETAKAQVILYRGGGLYGRPLNSYQFYSHGYSYPTARYLPALYQPTLTPLYANYYNAGANPFLYRDPVTPALYNLSPGAPPIRPYSTLGYYPRQVPYLGNFGYANVLPLTFQPAYYGQALGSYPGFYPNYLSIPVSAGDDLGLLPPVSSVSARPVGPSYDVASPKSGRDVLYSSTDAVRIRPAMYPALPAGAALLRQGLGAARGPDTASIEVTVPAGNAEVWFQGAKTTRTGTVREFVSPPLEPGSYTYTIRARWMSNGEQVERTRTVQVQPGENYRVNFTAN
jgi:uncharacterized protein (TIGR03000 family)